jgi:hypothetical protein
MRGRLEAEALRSVAWPAAEGVLTPEQFREAVDYLTTRSMQWRVRVEAGFETAEEGPAVFLAEDAPKLRDRIVLEAVIDVSSERARVAYLREITMLDAARRRFAQAGGGEATVEIGPANREGDSAATADEPGAGAQGPSPSRLGQVPSRHEAAERQRKDRFDPDMRGAMESPEPEEAGGSNAVPPAGGETPEPGRDRRIGRWSPAGGSQGGRR